MYLPGKDFLSSRFRACYWGNRYPGNMNIYRRTMKRCRGTRNRNKANVNIYQGIMNIYK